MGGITKIFGFLFVRSIFGHTLLITNDASIQQTLTSPGPCPYALFS